MYTLEYDTGATRATNNLLQEKSKDDNAFQDFEKKNLFDINCILY